METDAVLLGIFKRPAPFSFIVEQFAVYAVFEKTIPDHHFHGTGIGPVFCNRQLTDKIYIVIGFKTSSNRPYYRPQTKRALGINVWFARTARVLTVLQPMPDGLVAVNRILILAWRNIDIFRDLLQKSGILACIELS